MPVAVILLLLLAGGHLAAAPLVYPEPREIEVRPGSFPLDDRVIVAVPEGASAEDLALARLFVSQMSERYGLGLAIRNVSQLPTSGRVILMGSIENPLVKEYCQRNRLDAGKDKPGPEGYVLDTGGPVALVAGSDSAGAFYGLQSLRQLVTKVDGLRIPAVRIRDWPHKPFRGIKLYLPGRDNLPFLKRFVRDFMALYKYNKLIVELNAAMRLDHHPELNAGWIDLANSLLYSRRDRPEGPHRQYQDSTHHDTGDGGFLEKEEVAELVAWAARYHVEVIPELPSLTHSYYLLTRHRELAEIQDAEWPDTYCPLNPKSYELLFDVVDEYIEVMTPNVIHMGHDEWRMPWGACPRCRDKDPRELFAEDVNRIHDHLAAKGVRMAIWGDHLLEAVRGVKLEKNKTPSGYSYETPGALSPVQVKARIPKDILIFNWFWGREYPNLGEGNDSTLSDWGFEQVYGNFTPEIPNYERRSQRRGVLGGAPSAWVATTEYNFGKDLIYEFAGCASLLWSRDWPDEKDLSAIVQERMPEIRRNLSGEALPSAAGETVATVAIPSLVASSAGPAAGLDLTHLKSGTLRLGSKSFALPKPAFGAANANSIAIGEDVSSLIFLHASAKPAGNEPGHRYIYNFPDTADLLGWYEVAYQDGLVLTIPIRYGENILDWGWGRQHQPPAYCYRADPVDCSADRQSPITFFAFEWRNPRFGKAIREVRLRGSTGFVNPGGRVIPDNAVVLAAISVTKKR